MIAKSAILSRHLNELSGKTRYYVDGRRVSADEYCRIDNLTRHRRDSFLTECTDTGVRQSHVGYRI